MYLQSAQLLISKNLIWLQLKDMFTDGIKTLEMDVKYSVSSDLMVKIEDNQWEESLKWELAQQKLLVSLKRLKIGLLLEEPSEILASLNISLNQTFNDVKCVYCI